MATMFADYCFKFDSFRTHRTFLAVGFSYYSFTESDKSINCISYSSQNWSNYKEP